MSRLCVSIIFILSLSACIYPKPHENFKSFMQHDVGKKADDPSVLIARYPSKVGNSNILSNGNTEIEYIVRVSPPYKENCTTYFEVDKTTNIIVGWRFEGSEKGCVIMP